MKYTWERGWRTVLKKCSHEERGWVIACEREARRSVVEEEAYHQCMASPIGLTDCANIRVSRTSVRWRRHRGEFYVAICVILQPGTRKIWKGYRSRSRAATRRPA